MTVLRSLARSVGRTLLCSPAVLLAQQAPQTQPGQEALQEVVISVERVTQTLQSYAGTAVSATQSQLDSLGLENFVDLPALLLAAIFVVGDLHTWQQRGQVGEVLQSQGIGLTLGG